MKNLIIKSMLLLSLAISNTALFAADQFVVVVLDDSGSMAAGMNSSAGTVKMDAAKQALNEVLADVPDDAQVGVLGLNSMVDGDHWIVPLGPVDRASISNMIRRIHAEGGTPLGAAMKNACDALLKAREKNVYGTYRLLIVTDGEAGDQDLVEQYLPDIKGRGVVTDVIGVDMSGDHSLATMVNTYRRADNPESLKTAISEVFAETVDDTGAAGESDYDLLSGLSQEVAAAAVQHLTQMNNDPIGDGPVAATASAPRMQSPAPYRRTVTVPAQASDSGGSGMGALCFGGFVVLFLVFAFGAMMSQMNKQGRR